ncbi:hypothetical protein [Micromonospora tulbaghiae]|uniref:hypothetical protein n=1 Tax=Micromonospora tulbaghiae TaxID=479978 RepID=UPI003EBB1978
MLDLSAIARERVVLATVADLIMAATAGKALRVVVTCPASHVTVVGRLVRALHARGRPCHYWVSRSGRPDFARLESTDSEASEPTVMVIAGMTAPANGDEAQLINLRVATHAPTALALSAADRQASAVHLGASRHLDILLDYHDPCWPIVRHVVSRLSPPLAMQ